MQLLKEYYAWESYFLTKHIAANGGTRWLNNHVINFDDDIQDFFPYFMELFKRAVKQTKRAKMRVRVTKYRVVVKVEHPLVDRLLKTSKLPPAMSRRLDEVRRSVPGVAHFITTMVNCPADRYYVRNISASSFSRLTTSFEVRFTFNLEAAAPNYRYLPAAARKGQPKLLGRSGYTACLHGLITILDTFDSLLEEVNNIFAEDLAHIQQLKEQRIAKQHAQSIHVQQIHDFTHMLDLIKERHARFIEREAKQ